MTSGATGVGVGLCSRCSSRANSEFGVKGGTTNGVRLGADIEACSRWISKTQNRVRRYGGASCVAVGSDSDLGNSNIDGAEGEDGE